MHFLRLFAVAALSVMPCSVALAEVAPVALEQTLDRLMSILPGEFDSSRQMHAERAANTPEDAVHSHVYRSFIQIDVPDIGDNVLVSTVRYGGRDGQFDHFEFQVWTLTIDAERDAVEMKPRRFKAPEKFLADNRNPRAFKGLTLGRSRAGSRRRQLSNPLEAGWLWFEGYD